MESRGRLAGLAKDIASGQTLITFAVAGLPDVASLQDMDLRITAKRWTEKRSLEANAYFHVLVGKIAEVTRQSRIRVKNELIARYGQPETLDDSPLTYTTIAPPEYMAELETPHTNLIGTKAAGETVFYAYQIFRGSHTYNTAEMARLIDGTVSEAKDLDIETLTPRELEEMKARWKVETL